MAAPRVLTRTLCAFHRLASSGSVNLLSISRQAGHHHSLPIQMTRNLSLSATRYNNPRRYSDKHEWVSLDANDSHLGTVGISKYAQESLGDVVYVQLPEVGATFSEGDEVGAVESVKAASEIYTPVSGEIVEVNEALEEKPSLVNKDCLGEGWIFKIRLSKADEFASLMDEEAYEKFLRQLDEDKDN